MNRVTAAALSGLGVGIACAGLVALPNAFNPMGASFNQRLPLVYFLGLSLPGLVMSALLGLIAKKYRPDLTLHVVWASTAFLAVLLPAPSILNGRWADGLIAWYMPTAMLIGAFWGWSRQPAKETLPANPART